MVIQAPTIPYEELEKECTLLWEANRRHQEANQQLREQLAERDQRLAEQEREITTYQREIEHLRKKQEKQVHELTWLEQVSRLSSDTLTASQKDTVSAMRELCRSKTPNAQGYIQIEARELKRIEGLSKSTHRTHINYFADVYKDEQLAHTAVLHLFDKKLVTLRKGSKRGRPESLVFLKALPLLEYPAYWQAATTAPRPEWGGVRAHAGRRKKCECGGDVVEKDIIITKQRIGECNTCHTLQWVDDPRPINDARLPIKPDPGPGSGINNQVDFKFTDDEEEGISNQVDQVPLSESPNQLDWKSDEQEEEGLKNQLDFKYPEEDILETEEPSIPPMLLDTSQIEAAACDLLLEIAGPGPQHIEMNRGTIPDFSGKYITVDRKPHKGDMLAHLRGVRTKGASLRHPFNNTRALCFDADTSQDWQCLKEAALMLAAAAFKVILEESPAPEGKHTGGGHLWIIFDSYPDAYSARQTVVTIAPQLGKVKEYWPHEQGVNCPPNVRLPGGKYVTPGYEAWCHLTDAYGNELSHDGAGAASVLLEMQTPATLVKKHEQKTELVLTQEPITKPVPHAGGLLGEKADVIDGVLRDFEYSWDDLAALAGGYNEDGYFPAKWRGDGRNPNVKEWKGHDLATDFSSKAWSDCKTMDRYQVWCLLQAGENWREFRRLDLDQRCKAYRAERQEVAI